MGGRGCCLTVCGVKLSSNYVFYSAPTTFLLLLSCPSSGLSSKQQSGGRGASTEHKEVVSPPACGSFIPCLWMGHSFSHSVFLLLSVTQFIWKLFHPFFCFLLYLHQHPRSLSPLCSSFSDLARVPFSPFSLFLKPL